MRVLYIVVIILICCSCRQDNEFKIGHPLNEITPRALLKSDFERIWGIDMLVFQNQVEDTTFIFEFEELDFDSKLLSQSWEILVNSFDKELVEQILSPHKCHIISNYDESAKFSVFCEEHDITLLGIKKIDKDNGLKKLRLTYDVTE